VDIDTILDYNICCFHSFQTVKARGEMNKINLYCFFYGHYLMNMLRPRFDFIRRP